jgi:hypothetical protein
MLNSVVVFSFVALWHDLSFKLLAWGWLVSLFMVPELVSRWLLPKEVVRLLLLSLRLPLMEKKMAFDSTANARGTCLSVHSAGLGT